MNATFQPEDPFVEPDILIRGGLLLTMCEGQSPIFDSRIAIRGGIITGIGSGCPGKAEFDERHRAGEVIDARDCIVMPGLINAHAHSAMTLFRGSADDLPLKRWLFEKIFPAEARFLRPDTVYWGSLLACLEMIASGTTCVVDGYFFQDQTIRAVHCSGMRGVLAQGVIDFPAPGVPDPSENIRAAKKFIEKWRSFSDLITPGMFCHSPLTCSKKTLKAASEISRDFEVPLQVHLSETREEVEETVRLTGQRPARYLDDLGLLGEDLIAAHAVHLDAEEIKILSRAGVKVVHLPESNMKLASGAAPVHRMLEAGITPGIGTDGCASNNNLDLFQEMDSAAKLNKAFYPESTRLGADAVLKMATIWGARVAGLEKETGTVETGKKADLIVVDLCSPHMVPLYHPESGLVYSADGSDVRDVIVNGRILMRDRLFRTIDPEETMDRVAAIAREISGFNPS